MGVSLAKCRQTWCWRGTWGFYILICWQQEEKDSVLGLNFLKSQRPPTGRQFFPKGPTYSNKATISNSSQVVPFLMTMYSNIWAYWSQSYSNHQCLKRPEAGIRNTGSEGGDLFCVGPGKRTQILWKSNKSFLPL